jgi:acetyltransferase
VACKIASPDISHKSDVGGVEIGLRSASAVRAAFKRVTENARRARPEARIEGVTVQAMARPGREVIVGACVTRLAHCLAAAASMSVCS